MKVRALVLSGGGAKGAFQIGVLEELILRRRLDFRIFCGVSVGNLTAAYLAQARHHPDDPEASRRSLTRRFRALRAIWLEEIRGNRSIYRGSVLSAPGVVLGKDSLFDPGPLRRLIERTIRRRRLLASGRVLRIGLVSLLDGRFRVVTNHPTGAEDEISMADLTEAEVWDAIQASAAIPFVFPPVWIRGHIYVDGGVRNVTPLTHAFRERPHEIRAIFTAPQGRRIPVKDEGTFRDDALGIRVSALHILARAIEILTDEIYVEDVDGARLWNAILGAWNALARRLPPEVRATEPYRRLRALVGRKRRAALYEYYPEVFYGRRNAATEFRPQAIRRYYEHGLEIARAHPRGNGPSLP